MAKFFVTFVLLAFVALENDSIYNRLHAHSHPSNHPSSSRQEHTHHQLQHHQKAAAAAANERQEFLQRHEAEVQANHQRHYKQLQQYEQNDEERGQRRRKHLEEDLSHLKAMKRPWEHLRPQPTPRNERMFGDQPYDLLAGSSEVSEEVPYPHINWQLYNDEEEKHNHPTIEDEQPPLVQQLSNEDSEVFENNANDQKHHQHEARKDKSVESSTTIPKGCPKCETDRRIAHVTEEELTRMRIDFVKQQILEKLRLKERPHVAAVRLPKPIYEGTTIEHDEVAAQNKELDDYYARTSKKFIFLEREQHECQRLGTPSMCFSFKIDDTGAGSFEVNRAVLWLFKNKQKSNATVLRNGTMPAARQTIVVSEVQQQLEAQYLPVVKSIAIQTVDVQDEWMKIDIVWPIKRWFGNHDLSHLIYISCQSCDIDSMDEMISQDKDYRPFIMVDMQQRPRPSRQKRSINCTGGVTECCREKLYISFDEIGWGDWIIQPRGYDAYFCRGSCSSVASVTQSASYHTTFLLQHNNIQKSKGKRPLELIPCCTAKQYSSLQLVFMEGNATATQKTFPKMVVESCGCR